jgi:hypothetical protein
MNTIDQNVVTAIVKKYRSSEEYQRSAGLCRLIQYSAGKIPGTSEGLRFFLESENPEIRERVWFQIEWKDAKNQYSIPIDPMNAIVSPDARNAIESAVKALDEIVNRRLQR